MDNGMDQGMDGSWMPQPANKRAAAKANKPKPDPSEEGKKRIEKQKKTHKRNITEMQKEAERENK